jgi:hypothetical protein
VLKRKHDGDCIFSIFEKKPIINTGFDVVERTSFNRKSTMKRENRKSNEEDSMDSFEDIADFDKEQLDKP